MAEKALKKGAFCIAMVISMGSISPSGSRRRFAYLLRLQSLGNRAIHGGSK